MNFPTVRRSTLREKGQVTIPAEVRKALHLDPGDEIEFLVEEDGRVAVRGLKVVPADQAWFWTEQWQGKEADATADISAGRVTRHESAEQFLASLSD